MSSTPETVLQESEGYFGQERPEMRTFIPAEARVLLDVGCGSGAFSAGLRESRPGLGMELWGMEVDEEVARSAKGLDRLLVGPAEDRAAELPPGHFDCIVMNDVLEHLVWPERLLRAVAPALAPGGCVVASIPNVRYYRNVWNLAVLGRWDYVDYGPLDRTHLRFFTRRSCPTLFKQAGYRIVHTKGVNPTGSWFFRPLDILTLGLFADMRYLQYAFVAVPDPSV